MKDLINIAVGETKEIHEYERGKPHYEVMGNGLYRVIRENCYLVKERTVDFGNGNTIPFIEEGTQQDLEVTYALPEKVPFEVLHEILNFYKRVHELNRTEASVHIFYEDGTVEGALENLRDTLEPKWQTAFDNGIKRYGNFISYAPVQENSATLTSFGNDQVYARMTNMAGIIPVVETHSHHTMDAFWSGTDNANQNDSYYYLVVGRINTSDDLLLKWKVGNHIENIKVSEVFDIPQLTTTVKTTIFTTVTEKFKSLFSNTEEQDEEETVTVEDYKGVYTYVKDGFPETWFDNIVKTVVRNRNLLDYDYEDEYSSFKRSNTLGKRHLDKRYDVNVPKDDLTRLEELEELEDNFAQSKELEKEKREVKTKSTSRKGENPLPKSIGGTLTSLTRDLWK